MVDLGMVLNAVKPAFFISDGNIWTSCAVRTELEAVGNFFHIIPVAHPGDALGGEALEQLAGGIEEGFRLAVLPGGVLRGGGDFPAEVLRKELAAVADAEDRHAQPENFRVGLRGGGGVDAVGAAGKDEADGVHGS